MDFARDFLAQAKIVQRRELVDALEGLPRQGARRRGQEGLASALEKLGVDWTLGARDGRRAAAAAHAAAAGGDAKIAAGTVAKVRGVVKNIGSAPAYRVRAVLESDNPLFDENEMVFGKIAPRRIEELRAVGQDPDLVVHAHRRAQGDAVQPSAAAPRPTAPTMLVNIEGKARPMFAYTYQTIDDQKGSNHDGQVQRGEQVRMLVTVKNIGAGRAIHTEAVLRNGIGPGGDPDQRGPLRRQGPRPRARPRRSRSSTRSGPTSRATTTSWSWRWATPRSASR